MRRSQVVTSSVENSKPSSRGCQGFFCREGEEVVLQGVDAVEPPVGVGDGLDALGIEQTPRLEGSTTVWPARP